MRSSLVLYATSKVACDGGDSKPGPHDWMEQEWEFNDGMSDFKRGSRGVQQIPPVNQRGNAGCRVHDSLESLRQKGYVLK